MNPPRYKSRYLVITENYLWPILIILVALASLWFIFRSPFFQVKTITCQRDYQACQDPFILSELAKYKHLNLFLFPKEKLRQRILAGNKTVQSVQFSFQLPHTLKVNLTSTVPLVALQLKPDNQHPRYLLVDQNFRPISLVSQSQNLPLLITDQPYQLQLGQVISQEQLHQALVMVQGLLKFLPPNFQLQLRDTDLYLTLPHRPKIRLTTTRDPQAQLNLLQAVLSNAKMLEESQIKLIDVRFDQPVLKSY